MGTIVQIPQGMAPDSTGALGLIGFMQNVNSALLSTPPTIAGAATTNLIVTTDALLAGTLIMTVGSITGGFTITLPSTVSIIAAFGGATPGGTLPLGWSKRMSFLNSGIGQIGTVTAGDASTTVTGTATIATATGRDYIISLTTLTTLTLTNVGTYTFS
jgi:hypothetical protein